MVEAGLFHKFWFWIFSYSHQYVSQLSVAEALGMFCLGIYRAFRPVSTIWALAVLGSMAFFLCRRSRAHSLFVNLFLLSSFAAVCPGFYFRRHYFILILPAISILVGLAVGCATDKLRAWHGSGILRAVPLSLFLLAFSYTVFEQREFLFEMNPCVACRSMYVDNTFTEAFEAANFIRANSSPEVRIAVLGSEPEIYFYSHRHSATGYIYTYGLMDEQKYAATMQNEMIAEVESARPEYLVYVDNSRSWGTKHGSNMYIVAWAETYLHDNYTRVALAQDVRTQTCIPEEVSKEHPRTTPTIYLFRRRTS
jgi:hypothetical protein